jgi:hypothetical protein
MEPTPNSPRRGSRFVLIAVCVVLVVAAAGTLLQRWRRGRDAAGACTLNAEPAFVGDGLRAIAMGNRDTDSWGNVVVTIDGTGTAPTNHGQATGAYTVHIEDLPSLKRRTIQLDEFQKADGARWQPLTMRPGQVEVVATLRGEPCHYQSNLEPAATR